MEEARAILCIASYEKGQAFLVEAAAQGARVVLLTAEKLRNANWPRSSLAEAHTMPDDASPADVLRCVHKIVRHTHIDRVVPLDEFDLEAAALVREDLRLPGMGQTTTRHFRDKLAMRVAAKRAGIAVPEFVAVLNHDDLHSFVQKVPGPWVLKPRSSASAIGIRRIQTSADLWRTLDELGEQQTGFLLERFIAGNVFHVDSITWNRELQAQAVHQYGAPPMSLMQEGGVFTTRSLPRGSDLSRMLKELDASLLHALGMVSGVTHTEFIYSEEEDQLYFLETAARVGGAFIAELVEYSTGLNPWVEWARIETALLLDKPYRLPERTDAYAGSVICLARQEQPDLSAYTAPEIVLQINTPHHAGLILRSASPERIRELVEAYSVRFLQDFCAMMPAPDKPTS